MKKYFTIVFFAITSQLAAQGFVGGGSLGIVASQVNGDELSGYNKLGLCGGLFVRNEFNDRYSLQMDIQFIQKGSRKRTNPEDGDYSYFLLRLSYVEVPIMFQAKVYKKFYAEGGLALGYLIRARQDADGNGMLEPDPAFKRFDIPYIIGVSYGFTDNIRFNIRHSFSIIAIRDFPGQQSYYFDSGQYNKLLTFSCQLSF
jgi:hypothetical protein